MEYVHRSASIIDVWGVAELIDIKFRSKQALPEKVLYSLDEGLIRFESEEIQVFRQLGAFDRASRDEFICNKDGHWFILSERQLDLGYAKAPSFCQAPKVPSKDDLFLKAMKVVQKHATRGGLTRRHHEIVMETVKVCLEEIANPEKPGQEGEGSAHNLVSKDRAKTVQRILEIVEEDEDGARVWPDSHEIADAIREAFPSPAPQHDGEPEVRA